MREMLDEKLNRFEELERQLVDPTVLANSAHVGAIAREHGSLAKLATKYRRFKQLNQQIAEAREMAEGSDADMRELAEAELPGLRAEREKSWDELLDMTIGGEDANRSRCVMEIRAGTGGDEAALFARDLYDMYKHYCEDRGWKLELLDMSPTELGGFKDIVLGIEGEGAYRASAIRKRRPSRAARAGNRSQGPHPYFRRHRGRHARAGRRGNRHQAGRLSAGFILRQRPRRPARQQNASAVRLTHLRNRHRRAMPGRKEPAQELSQGTARVEDAALRTEARTRTRQARRNIAARWSAPATAASASARTIFPKTA